MLALLVGCGLRRSEVAALDLAQRQLREARRLIADLRGKGRRTFVRCRSGPGRNFLSTSGQALRRSATDASSAPSTSRDARTAPGDGKRIWWIVADYAGVSVEMPAPRCSCAAPIPGQKCIDVCSVGFPCPPRLHVQPAHDQGHKQENNGESFPECYL